MNCTTNLYICQGPIILGWHISWLGAPLNENEGDRGVVTWWRKAAPSSYEAALFPFIGTLGLFGLRDIQRQDILIKGGRSPWP